MNTKTKSEDRNKNIKNVLAVTLSTLVAGYSLYVAVKRFSSSVSDLKEVAD